MQEGQADKSVMQTRIFHAVEGLRRKKWVGNGNSASLAVHLLRAGVEMEHRTECGSSCLAGKQGFVFSVVWFNN